MLPTENYDALGIRDFPLTLTNLFNSDFVLFYVDLLINSVTEAVIP